MKNTNKNTNSNDDLNTNKYKDMTKEQLLEVVVSLNDVDEKNKKLSEDYQILLQQFLLYKKGEFGKKSEVTEEFISQFNLFNDAELIADEVVEQEEATIVKEHKRKKSNEADYSKLRTIEIHHEIKPAMCGDCSGFLKEVKSTIQMVIKYKPAEIYAEKHIIHNYYCPNCSDDEQTVFSKGESVNRVIKGSVASSSLVAGIIHNKYVSHVPLYRQEADFKRNSIPISRQNMSRWLIKVSDNYLTPIYEAMRIDLVNQDIVHCDETTIKVLDDPNSINYMWLAMSGKHSKIQCALYRYDVSRKYSVIKDFLGADYTGYIHSDAYEAYNKFDNATNVLCMAHARRYFFEALEANPCHNKAKKLKGEALNEYIKENPGYGVILSVFIKINKLFEFESKYVKKKLSPQEILERREKEQRDILNEIKDILDNNESNFPMKSKSGKAISYTLNQWDGLLKYMKDGRLELSNNRGERAIKPFVLSRKNFLFCKANSGAKSSATIFSIVESAKMNNIKIFDYFEYVLEELSKIYYSNGKKISVNEIQHLLPYSKELPARLKVKR